MMKGISDKNIEILLRVAKTNKGLRAFFGSPHGMIALRNEAARRGIYATAAERERAVKSVIQKLEEAS